MKRNAYGWIPGSAVPSWRVKFSDPSGSSRFYVVWCGGGRVGATGLLTVPCDRLMVSYNCQPDTTQNLLGREELFRSGWPVAMSVGGRPAHCGWYHSRLDPVIYEWKKLASKGAFVSPNAFDCGCSMTGYLKFLPLTFPPWWPVTWNYKQKQASKNSIEKGILVFNPDILRWGDPPPIWATSSPSRLYKGYGRRKLALFAYLLASGIPSLRYNQPIGDSSVYWRPVERSSLMDWTTNYWILGPSGRSQPLLE